MPSNIMRDEYGNGESNPINDEIRRIRDAIAETVALDDSRLAKVTRLRLVTDPGFPMYDLSYCYGELRDGSPVRVRLPQSQFSRRKLKSDLTKMCKSAKVYGKGLGILDDEVLSILC